jgi:hypothetical protein
LSNTIAAPSIIDVEASGFGAASYPIELGVALSCGKRLSMLIKPEPDWVHWDVNAQQVHGVSRELLLQNGKPVDEVAKCFNVLLKGQTVYSDGWSVDKPWISALFHAAGLAMDFSVSPIEQIMRESQFEIWDLTKKNLFLNADQARHRASQDALIIQQTYVQTRTITEAVCVENPRQSPTENEPILPSAAGYG